MGSRTRKDPDAKLMIFWSAVNGLREDDAFANPTFDPRDPGPTIDPWVPWGLEMSFGSLRGAVQALSGVTLTAWSQRDAEDLRARLDAVEAREDPPIPPLEATGHNPQNMGAKQPPAATPASPLRRVRAWTGGVTRVLPRR